MAKTTLHTSITGSLATGVATFDITSRADLKTIKVDGLLIQDSFF